jgi:hypothetical protein
VSFPHRRLQTSDGAGRGLDDCCCNYCCGIFATLAEYFDAATVESGFSVPMSPGYNKNRGRLG